MKLGLIAAYIALALLGNGCTNNPVTGKKQAFLMSEAKEIELGKEADPQILAAYGLYKDSVLQTFISEKGNAMVAVSHRPQLKFHFRIVDSDVLNAFAIPGGYVYFTRGILAYLNDEAQFAGVLGHEIGHITARHSAVQQRNQILGELGIIAGSVISPEFGRFAETASQGLGLMLLKFGRDAERQSDELGVEYASKIGYDAKQMAAFFETLDRQTQAAGANRLPEFLSTHPNPGDRNTTVAKLAQQLKQKLKLSNPAVNRNAYLKIIDGLVYGEDPRQGFTENNFFYHPDLLFQFPVPQGWQLQNSPQRIQITAKDGKAIMLLSVAKGRTLQEAATAALEGYGLQIIEQKNIQVNGLNTLRVIADPQQHQAAALRTQNYFIQYGNLIYHFLGACNLYDFDAVNSYFTETMQQFKELTDSSKINKKPQRIHVKTIAKSTTLEKALKAMRATAPSLNELAILNGMKLTDTVTEGTLIKIVAP